MRPTLWMAFIVAGLTLCAPALARAEEAGPSPTPIPPLIERVGLPTSQTDALQRVQFRPFIPGKPIETAVLAPFHTVGQSDNPKNYGIAFAYVQKGHTFVLREWPRSTGAMGTFTALPGEPACQDSYLTFGTLQNVQGIGWQTARTIFVLQADDEKLAHDRGRALKAEWHRLALRGACR